MQKIRWDTIRLWWSIYNERKQKLFFQACVDHFSKIPSAEVCEHASANGIEKFLQNYTLLHGVTGRVRLVQAPCQIGRHQSNLCEQHNNEGIAVPIFDHRAIGLVEPLHQTTKRQAQARLH